MNQSSQKSSKNLFYLATIPIFLIVIIWAFNKLAFYGNGRKATEAEARSIINEIIKNQREYYLKNQQFSNNSLEKIDLGTNKYEYQVDVLENKVIIFAKLKSKDPKNLEEFIKKIIYPDIVGDARSFVAGMFLLPVISNSEANIKVILCQSQNSGTKELNPPFLKDQVPTCPVKAEPLLIK